MLVSITVPTHNRESRLPMLHAQFEHQSWSGGELELVVLDDSPEPSAYFRSVRSDRVRYIHDPVRASVGAKRARLLELAKGECHIHFDDDDFYAPDYVATTLAHLSDNDFFHYDTWHIYRECDQTIWFWDTRELLGLHFEVSGSASEVPKVIRTWAQQNDVATNQNALDWLHKNRWGWGFCYAYRSAIARRAGFPDVWHGEDYQFVKRLQALGARMHLAPDDAGRCVHVLRSEGSARCFPQYRLPDHLARHLLALPPGALAT